MRKIMTVAISLLCAAIVLAAGCGSKQAQNPSEQPLPARDTSTLDSALLGHWQDQAGNQLLPAPIPPSSSASRAWTGSSSGAVSSP